MEKPLGVLERVPSSAGLLGTAAADQRGLFIGYGRLLPVLEVHTPEKIRVLR